MDKEKKIDKMTKELMDTVKKIQKATIIDNFKPYIDARKDNDYVLEINGQRVMTQTNLMGSLQRDWIDEENKVWTKAAVDGLNPDIIDNKLFWKIATDNFPYYSVVGRGVDQAGNVIVNSPLDVNGHSFRMHDNLNTLPYLFHKLKENPDAVVVEIGCGHGMLPEVLGANGFGDNYWGIDINPLFDHQRVYECDGKSFPNGMPHEVDYVYSVNVFQHLGRNQRQSYYEEVFDRLVPGGEFIFGMFIMTAENEGNDKLWGVKDEEGNVYASFFKQLTPIDKLTDVREILSDVGFEEVNYIPTKMEGEPNYHFNNNYICLTCRKPLEY